MDYCKKKLFFFQLLIFFPTVFYAQQRQSGLLLGYNHEIPATEFFSLSYFYGLQRWTGELELEIPFPSTNTLNIGSKLAICYSLFPLKAKVKPYLKTAFEVQHTKLSLSNHKSSHSLGSLFGLGTQFNIYKQYSMVFEAMLGRRNIFYDTSITIWIPLFSAKLKYTLSYK